MYVLLQIDNFKFHAADTAVVKEPVANFGNSERYTLYRVGNELNCDLLADNRNRILFCPESEEQVFIEHYSDYNNCRFKICIDYDEKNIYEVSLKKIFSRSC